MAMVLAMIMIMVMIINQDHNYFQHPKCYIVWLAVSSIVSAVIRFYG